MTTMDATAGGQSTAGVESGTRLDLWLIVLTIVAVSASVFLRFSNVDGKVCSSDECMARLRVAGYCPSDLEHAFHSYAQPVGVNELRSFMHADETSRSTSSRGALLREYFQVSPLYYFAARIWTDIFGDGTVPLRYFSVVTSLLSLPLIYLLALELFGSRRAACLALCLVASSPVFLIYAQQARFYSIWIVTVLLASLTLLRAIRLGGIREWAGYSASLAVCFLADPLSILVALSHAAFVFLRSRLKATHDCKAFIVSVTLASLALAPKVCFSSFDFITGHSTSGWLYLSHFWLPKYLWDTTIEHWTRLFWDDIAWKPQRGDFLMSFGLAFLVFFSVYYITKYGSRKQKLFVDALILPSICMLTTRDILLHEHSLTITRYMFPSLIGVELAVAFLFATKLAARPGTSRSLWTTLFVAVVLVGFHGSARALNSLTTWAAWPQADDSVRESAALINRMHHPVVLIPCKGKPGLSLMLANRLKSDARIIAVSPQAAQWQSILQTELESGAQVFLWDPIPSRIDKHLGGVKLSLEKVDSQGKLFRVKPMSTAGTRLDHVLWNSPQLAEPNRKLNARLKQNLL